MKNAENPPVKGKQNEFISRKNAENTNYIKTKLIIMDDSDDGSTGSNSTLTQESQKTELIDIYNSGVKRQFQKSTLQSINKAIRKIALPKIKFLPATKSFGGYDMPDLTSDDCWVHKIFEEINMGRSSLRKRAEIWMTYRNKIKEQFGLHRSSVTMKIKKKFISGKSPLQILNGMKMMINKPFAFLSPYNKQK